MKERLPELSKEQLQEVGEELCPVQCVKDSLEVNEKGFTKQNLGNAVRILKDDPMLKGAICYNELTERIDIIKDLGWRRDDRAITDTDMAYIMYYVEQNYEFNNIRWVEKAIQVTANENRFHPIRDTLNSLVWDGIPRVDNMLTHFFGVEKTELITESMRVFMLGAVSRVFRPGIKFELTICLVGDQGVGKSTFFRFLAIKDEYFSDDLKRIDDEKIVVKLQGHWIIELAEMLAIVKAKHVEDTKDFISRQSDTYRTPYAVNPRDRKRQCVFAGTSNKLEVLPMDKSGNRRIVPIEAHMENAEVHILEDEEASRAYILQAWAEIMEIYRGGAFKLTLSKRASAELVKYQERYTPEDTDAEAIADFLEHTKEQYVCVSMLAREALGYPAFEKLRKSDCNNIAEIMRTMPEWEKAGTRSIGVYGKQRVWKRKTPLQAGAEPGEEPEQLEIPFEVK